MVVVLLLMLGVKDAAGDIGVVCVGVATIPGVMVVVVAATFRAKGGRR